MSDAIPRLSAIVQGDLAERAAPSPIRECRHRTAQQWETETPNQTLVTAPPYDGPIGQSKGDEALYANGWLSGFGMVERMRRFVNVNFGVYRRNRVLRDQAAFARTAPPKPISLGREFAASLFGRTGDVT